MLDRGESKSGALDRRKSPHTGLDPLALPLHLTDNNAWRSASAPTTACQLAERANTREREICVSNHRNTACSFGSASLTVHSLQQGAPKPCRSTCVLSRLSVAILTFRSNRLWLSSNRSRCNISHLRLDGGAHYRCSSRTRSAIVSITVGAVRGQPTALFAIPPRR